MASVFKSESFLKLSPADQSRNINLINLGRFLENYFEFGLKNEKVFVCVLIVCTRESSEGQFLLKSGNRNNTYIEKWGSMYYIGTPTFRYTGYFCYLTLSEYRDILD